MKPASSSKIVTFVNSSFSYRLCGLNEIPCTISSVCSLFVDGSVAQSTAHLQIILWSIESLGIFYGKDGEKNKITLHIREICMELVSSLSLVVQLMCCNQANRTTSTVKLLFKSKYLPIYQNIKRHPCMRLCPVLIAVQIKWTLHKFARIQLYWIQRTVRERKMGAIVTNSG